MVQNHAHFIAIPGEKVHVRNRHVLIIWFDLWIRTNIRKITWRIIQARIIRYNIKQIKWQLLWLTTWFLIRYVWWFVHRYMIYRVVFNIFVRIHKASHMINDMLIASITSYMIYHMHFFSNVKNESNIGEFCPKNI